MFFPHGLNQKSLITLKVIGKGRACRLELKWLKSEMTSDGNGVTHELPHLSSKLRNWMLCERGGVGTAMVAITRECRVSQAMVEHTFNPRAREAETEKANMVYGVSSR